MHPLRILRFPSEYQKTMFRSALFALLASPVAALYSVHFMPGAGHSNVVRKPGVFATAPDAAQVADIYARLAGIAPVLHEAEINMPVPDFSMMSDFNDKPVLIEAAGGVVPKSFARPLFLSGNDEMGPSLDDVVELLGKNDIAVDSKKFESMSEARSWAEGQSKSVILLHHEEFRATNVARRLTNSSNAYMPLTEEDISSYQIFYWVFFVFLSLLLAGVLSIFSMEVLPDSLLFAKFQSSRTGKAD